MVHLRTFPYLIPPSFKASDVKRLAFSDELCSKGLAEDLGNETLYDMEKVTIRFFIRAFVRALYTGSTFELTEILENVHPSFNKFVEQIGQFVEDLWIDISYYQKAILYYSLINEYSIKDIAYILNTSPSTIKRQFLHVAEHMSRDSKYDRLHQIMLQPSEVDKVNILSIFSNLAWNDQTTEII